MTSDLDGLGTDGQPATEVILQELSRQDIDWKFLGRELGLSEAVLSEIEEDKRGHSREMKYQALLKWKQSCSNPTIGDLVSALRKLQRLDLIEIIRCKAVEDSGDTKNPVQLPVRSAAPKNKPKHFSIRSKAKQKGRHNLVLGNNDPSDVVLYRDSVKITGVFPKIRRHTFQYHKRPSETITGVLVEDNWDDDTGGTPKRIDGGPGKTCIEVEVTSQWGRGLSFIFIVYGRRE